MSKNKKMDWLSRLTGGLSRSSAKITQNINDLFVKRKLDVAALEKLEEVLLTNDLGVETTSELIQAIKSSRFDQEITSEEVRKIISTEITKILEPVAIPLRIDSENRPHVIIVCGVNGVGKTTTIGKLAQGFVQEGKKVMLAAGDTFRAAAIEQLQLWGEKTKTQVIASEIGKDPASLAFDALTQAKTEDVDVLLIDTAGRLQNKKELMDELGKITRVICKIDPTAPHNCILIIDANTGQNAHSQVEIFLEVAKISGLIITKLDGSSKGGVMVSLAQKFRLPIHAVGVGESAEDLQPFEPNDFANSLMGLET